MLCLDPLADMLADMLAAYAARYPNTLAFDFIRYVVGAGGVYLIINIALAARLARRKIRPDAPPGSQIRREILASLRTVLIFAAVGSLIGLGAEAGIIPIYRHVADYGVPWLVASIAVIIVAHDAWFYWTHWFMHKPRWFRWFHRLHHKSHNPTPFASYAFDASEAALNAAFFPLVLLVVPAHPIALLAFTGHMMLRNAIGHCGYEVFPARADGRPRFDWLTTVTHHDLHHSESRWNFGLYFTWWDRWMRTEHPDYHARFKAALGKGSISAPASRAVNGVAAGAVALMLLAAPAADAGEAGSPPASDIAGLWLTEGLEGVIEIAPCADAPELRCGEVVWTWFAADWPHAGPGDLVLRDLKPDGDVWVGGVLRHPASGVAFTGDAVRAGPDALRLEGCVLLICKTATWRSLASLAALHADLTSDARL